MRRSEITLEAMETETKSLQTSKYEHYQDATGIDGPVMTPQGLGEEPAANNHKNASEIQQPSSLGNSGNTSMNHAK